MATFTIEIDDFKRDEFVAWCSMNGIEPERFITSAFIEKYAVSKYGDLNEKFNNSVSIDVTKEVKPKRTKKEKRQEAKSEETKDDKTVANATLSEEPKKRTRVIKSK